MLIPGGIGLSLLAALALLLSLVWSGLHALEPGRVYFVQLWNRPDCELALMLRRLPERAPRSVRVIRAPAERR